MGTKLTELRSGCFYRALDDEPMFVLLARDTSAPGFVEGWAGTREAEIHYGKRPASDMAQVTEARQTARRMRVWRHENDGAWRAGFFADPGPIALDMSDEARARFLAGNFEPVIADHPHTVTDGPYVEPAPRYARPIAEVEAANMRAIDRHIGRRTAYDRAGLAEPEKLERIAIRAMLPWYVWAVLLFAAGFIVGRIA